MSDASDIESVITNMFDKFTHHDEAGVEGALDVDCTVWDVFVPELIEGEETRLAYHAADQAQSQLRGPIDLRIEMLRTDIWGDVGLVRYLVRFEYQSPNATSGVVRITTVLVRKEDGWAIVHHHEGMLPEGIPPIEDQ